MNLPDYMGDWFEIASYKKGCFTPKTTHRKSSYYLERNGSIVVAERGRLLNYPYTMIGIAEIDPEFDDPSRLHMSFHSCIPSWREYWIVSTDYRYSIVGNIARNSLVILYREPHMPSDLYEKCLQVARQCRFDTDKLVRMDHGEPQSKL